MLMVRVGRRKEGGGREDPEEPVEKLEEEVGKEEMEKWGRLSFEHIFI
jgi:hypothetical protein